MSLKDCIVDQIPFECDNFDELRRAIEEAYNSEWLIRLDHIMSQLECLRPVFEDKTIRGSWNLPLIHVGFQWKEKEAYKVFRKHIDGSIFYEFHPAEVTKGKWLEAEISGSDMLTGLRDTKHPPRFHMLLDQNQANIYAGTRKDCDFFKNEYSVDIQKVNARNLTTIDLVFIPPKQFVWGIDAKEMYIQ